jgi:hypothetical protein
VRWVAGAIRCPLSAIRSRTPNGRFRIPERGSPIVVRVAAACIAVCTLVVATAFAAQEGWFGRRERSRQAPPEVSGNTAYDGRFVFVRLEYGSGLSQFQGFRRGREAPWAHDYPRADVHFMKILDEITLLTPRLDGSNVLSLDDEELFEHPFAYMSEPGFWQPTDEEVEGLRAYLAKGGFLIFDDFRGSDWYNVEEQMRRVIPGSRFVDLDGTHPVFHSFFEIDAPLEFVPPYGGEPPRFLGLFEDNDPSKRLVVVANLNNDLGEYWEFSDTGWVPIDLSNEAYKFGVNYVMYAMTH